MMIMNDFMNIRYLCECKVSLMFEHSIFLIKTVELMRVEMFYNDTEDPFWNILSYKYGLSPTNQL